MLDNYYDMDDVALLGKADKHNVTLKINTIKIKKNCIKVNLDPLLQLGKIPFVSRTICVAVLVQVFGGILGPIHDFQLIGYPRNVVVYH